MTLLRVGLGSLFVASFVPLGCSSAGGGADSPAFDGGVETSPPPASAPPQDAGAPDTGRADFVPASRLAVACAAEPCYVAVSGNTGEHVCGLLKDGSVRCWGRDTRPRAETSPDEGEPQADGALGRGRVVSALEGATPAPVVGLTGATQISVGKNLGTCARTGDGSVYCWGRNEYGQLGRPAAEARLADAHRRIASRLVRRARRKHRLRDRVRRWRALVLGRARFEDRTCGCGGRIDLVSAPAHDGVSGPPSGASHRYGAHRSDHAVRGHDRRPPRRTHPRKPRRAPRGRVFSALEPGGAGAIRAARCRADRRVRVSR